MVAIDLLVDQLYVILVSALVLNCVFETEKTLTQRLFAIESSQQERPVTRTINDHSKIAPTKNCLRCACQ